MVINRETPNKMGDSPQTHTARKPLAPLDANLDVRGQVNLVLIMITFANSISHCFEQRVLLEPARTPK